MIYLEDIPAAKGILYDSSNKPCGAYCSERDKEKDILRKKPMLGRHICHFLLMVLVCIKEMSKAYLLIRKL